MSVLHASFDSDFTPYLAFATRDGFSVLNVDHLEENTFETSESGVGCIQIFRSNGTAMVAIVGSGDLAGSSPRKLKILDVNTRQTVCELSFQSSILSCSINSNHIAVCLESKIHIIEVNGMKTIKKISTATNSLGIMSLSKSVSPSLLAYPTSSSTGKVTVMNINALGAPTTAPDISYNAHKSPLVCLQMNGNGELTATASTIGTIIRVFNTRTGLVVSEFRRGLHHASITSLLFCPHDSILVVGSSTGTVHIFQLSERVELDTRASDQSLEVKPRNIFGIIFRAAFTSVQMELRNKNKNSARASFIARIPSLEGPICMTVMHGGVEGRGTGSYSNCGNGSGSAGGCGSGSDNADGNADSSISIGDSSDKKLYVVTASGYLFR